MKAFFIQAGKFFLAFMAASILLPAILYAGGYFSMLIDFNNIEILLFIVGVCYFVAITLLKNVFTQRLAINKRLYIGATTVLPLLLNAALHFYYRFFTPDTSIFSKEANTPLYFLFAVIVLSVHTVLTILYELVCFLKAKKAKSH